MFALLVIPVLVAGFFAFHIHPVYKFKLHRFEGQYLYLKSAQFGFMCFFLALLYNFFSHKYFPNKIFSGTSWEISLALYESLVDEFTKIVTSPDEAKKISWLVMLSCQIFGAALFIKAWAHLSLRARFGKWNPRLAIIAEILEDSPLDNLLFQISMDKSKQIMLTMDDRKVYVGKIIQLGEPSETSGMDQDIVILPVMSGYRDKDNLKVVFTTYYKDVNKELELCLRQDSIVSATEFSNEAYKIWNPENLSRNDAKKIRVKFVNQNG
ncbi:hypothetical protein [Delftia acidovorans]|uniref:hypothetical protein n=1 Tax=Delftia acidovorans TaxID=80866 RepID=UPI0022ABA7A1|nr:hypothetical protein [Delftia acidovorans]WAT88373.1 hypothetical protein O1V13_14315 [Delftia acidovorans]